jgi:MFS family permease
MAQDSISASSPHFEIGRVISTSLAVFSRNFGPFFVLALVIGIPYIGISVGAASSLDLSSIEQTGQLPPGFWGMVIIGSLIYLLTYVVTQSVIIYGTFQDLRGQKASFGDCLARGFAVLPRVLIAAILASVAVMLASMLFIIPGIILGLMWWVFVPVLVIEGAGIGQSFGRSRDLTRGHRWGILGLLLIVGVAQWLVGLVLGLVAPVLGMIGGEIVNIIVMFFFTAFAGVMVAVGYYYLRAEKEGIIIDDIAKVFD